MNQSLERGGEQGMHDLLPWFANGTLDAASRARVTAWVAESPAHAAELMWWQGLHTQIQRDAVECAHEPGLSRLLAQIEAERSGKVTPLIPRAPRRWFAPRRDHVLRALAASAVLGIALALTSGLGPPDQDPSQALRPLNGGSAQRGHAMLQLTFKPHAREQQIRAVLATIDGEIVSGPGALGVYHVKIPAGRVDELLGLLRSTHIESVVDSATITSR
ncbi:MAG: hypothetical protein JNM76_17020 [Betaproteobacteria bacterium]|nr:hypothetical protein [Betaproteobacteria bacterium]